MKAGKRTGHSHGPEAQPAPGKRTLTEALAPPEDAPPEAETADPSNILDGPRSDSSMSESPAPVQS